MEAILQLDGTKTVQQITSLESHTPTMPTPSSSTEEDAKVSEGNKRESLVGAQERSRGPVADSRDEIAPGPQMQVSDQAQMQVSDSDLDSLASKAAGLGQRYACRHMYCVCCVCVCATIVICKVGCQQCTHHIVGHVHSHNSTVNLKVVTGQ